LVLQKRSSRPSARYSSSIRRRRCRLSFACRPRPLPDYKIEGVHRLFGYYARHGIQGNANVATWLLGRTPGSYDAYVQRSLKEVFGS
jgi:hypothetical protein